MQKRIPPTRSPIQLRQIQNKPDTVSGIFGMTEIVRLVTSLQSLEQEWKNKLLDLPKTVVGPKGNQGVPGVSIRGPKGEKGDKGDRGEKGEQGIAGKDGITPKVDYTSLKAFILENMPIVQKEDKTFELDEDKVVKILKKKKLNASDIDGLEQTASAIFSQLFARGGYLHGGGVPSLTAGSNVTLTTKSDGGYIVSASSGGVGAWSTPAETPNGVITVFTVTSQPTDVVADGIEFYDGFGYTYAAGQITFTNPPTQYVRYR